MRSVRDPQKPRVFILGNHCETLDCGCHPFHHFVIETAGQAPPLHAECDCYLIDFDKTEQLMDYTGLVLLGFSLFFWLLSKKGIFLFTAGVGTGLLIGAYWAAMIIRSAF